MGCHPRALVRVDQAIREAIARRDPNAVDELLDRRYDAEYRATEWDADQWGFDPDRWCETERVQLGACVR